MRWVFAVLGVVTVAMSSATFIMYAIDKRAARLGKNRVAERTLHRLELLGGWLGALIAQRALRHKTRKTRFLVIFWLIALLHIAVWIALSVVALR